MPAWPLPPSVPGTALITAISNLHVPNERKHFTLSSLPLTLTFNMAHPLLETIFLSFNDSEENSWFSLILPVLPAFVNTYLFGTFSFLNNQHEFGGPPLGSPSLL